MVPGLASYRETAGSSNRCNVSRDRRLQRWVTMLWGGMGIQEALRKAAEMQSHLQIISVVEYGPYWIFSYCEPGLTPEECPGMPMLKIRRTDGFSTYLHVQDKDFLDIVKHATKVDLPEHTLPYSPTS